MSKNPQMESVELIKKDDADYPPALAHCLGAQVPATLTIRGNRALLQRPALGLFCSVKCPGTVIVRTYDLARSLRDSGAALIGGFQSPMERECLTLLLRGSGPVIVCPARGIDSRRVPHEWRTPLVEGRLLVLTPFAEGQRRATTVQATMRNLCVAALADEILIPYAALGGKTEMLAKTVVAWGKSLLTVESDANNNLVDLGAQVLSQPSGRIKCTP